MEKVAKVGMQGSSASGKESAIWLGITFLSAPVLRCAPGDRQTARILKLTEYKSNVAC